MSAMRPSCFWQLLAYANHSPFRVRMIWSDSQLASSIGSLVLRGLRRVNSLVGHDGLATRAAMSAMLLSFQARRALDRSDGGRRNATAPRTAKNRIETMAMTSGFFMANGKLTDDEERAKVARIETARWP